MSNTENDRAESSAGTYHGGEQVPDHQTRKTLLVASPKDTVQIDGHGEMTVVNRSDPYFGPEITLDDEGHNHKLIPHGFAHNPELWRADVNERGYIEGWELVGQVSAEVVDVGKSSRCPDCGAVLENMHQRRTALVAGVCPHE